MALKKVAIRISEINYQHIKKICSLNYLIREQPILKIFLIYY